MRKTIFPYPTLVGELELSLTEPRIDNQLVPPEAILPNERSILLFGHDPNDWTNLTLRIDVEVPPAELERFENEHGAVNLVVVASCRPTNTRQPIPLQRSPLGPSHWGAKTTISRSGFREKVVLQAILTAAVQGVPHRPVAVSESWTLHFDPSESLRIAGTLAVKWCDFKSESAPPIARQFSDSSHVVDLDQPLPEILLNSSFEGLEPLLRDAKDRSPVEQALHDSTRMSIARSVWMALLGDAMSAVIPGEDGEDPTWPNREWHAEVLKRILPEIEPAKSETEILNLAAGEWQAHPGSATFLSRSEAVIGDLVGANKALRKSTQTLLRKGIVS
ncbi:MAG: hypothetical protein KF708_06870 [Pirellulales bacterium]|nr:hypothetical protein [Pirellulales bacterium]